MNEIIPGLYLGNIAAASDTKLLNRFGITHIVRVLKGNFGKVHYDRKYLIIQIDDMPNENIQKYFESSHKFIDGALNENENGGNNKVLVHWQVGMSRSATIVISYIMKKFPDMTWNKALRFVKSKRPIVSPNDGFLRQLKSYERILERSRLAEKISTKITYETPVKSGPKFENPYSQLFESKPKQDNKYVNSSTRNYHYSRGASANTNSRSIENLQSEHKEEDVKEYFVNRHKSSVAMNAEKSILEQSLKLNATNMLQK